MAGINAVFGRPFKQQVAAFRLRLGNLAPTAKWTDIWQAEHDRAFMVAGAIKADVLADIAAMIDKAISQGTTLETFRKEFRAMVATKGWQISPAGQGTKGGEAWRTRLIYKTNLSVSYAAGRFAQLVEANHAYWIYFHGASLEPREQHLAWDGLILPPSHPFWATHAPPNGWGCSCYIIGAGSMAGAIRRGGKPDLKLPDNWQALDPRTGAPLGIDKGWAYAPGASVVDTVNLAASKIASLPAQLGSALGQGQAEVIKRAWPEWLRAVEASDVQKPGLVGVIKPDVLEALAGVDRRPASAEIMVRPGLVTGPKAERHLAKGDALTVIDWQNLPDLVVAPKAVLLDTKTGNLIYLLEGENSAAQLAIHLDYLTRIDRIAVTTNMVVSAYRPDMSEFARRVASGALKLLLGSLG
jgi:Phage Mu protein F like protein